MKHLILFLFVLCIGLFFLIFSLPNTAAAQTGGTPPNQDTYTSRNNPNGNFNGQTLFVSYDNLFSGFQPSDFSYLQFDLTAVATPINYATLDLTVVNNISGAEDVTIGLYSVLEDGWNASTMTHAIAPAAGSLLQTVTIAGDFTGEIRFGNGSNAHPLGTFLEGERMGDGFASLMLRVESATTPFFQGTVSMEDVEGSFDGQSGNEPVLMPSESPTAITLSQLNGSTVLPSPLYLLIPFLLLGLITLFAIKRNR